MSEASPPSETPVAMADTEAATIEKPAEAEARSHQAPETGSTATDDKAQKEQKDQRSQPRELPTVEGKVIGWNDGGFHVVVDGKTGFCPRSEMEVGAPRTPKDYVDETFTFSVLRVEKGGKRIVLSRKARLESDRKEVLGKLQEEMDPLLHPSRGFLERVHDREKSDGHQGGLG